MNGPLLININVDTIQEFEPKLKSKKINNKIVTPSLEIMYPFLSDEVNAQILKNLMISDTQKIKGIIFDLDGTLIDSDKDIERIINYIRKKDLNKKDKHLQNSKIYCNWRRHIN